MKDMIHDIAHQLNRREFLKGSVLGLGAAALGSMLNTGRSGAAARGVIGQADDPATLLPHFVPKAKRVIYLFQSGAPSQLELFDYKPKLREMFGQELPASVRGDQRLTGMSSGQRSFPLAFGKFEFAQYGQSRAWLSDLLPYHTEIADRLCFIKSMHTEAINHDPAVTFVQTGSQQAGRPSFGSWVSYGLGSDNENLPTFCVLLSKGKDGDQPLYAKLWGNGFLPSEHQGVMFRSGKDPVLYLNDPSGIDKTSRRRMLDYLAKLHGQQFDHVLDPEVNSRVSQYEMAYRMQTSVPETLDISREPDYIYDMYGPESRQPGTFAANCLLARRLAEKGVRFVQLYHQGWDNHNDLPAGLTKQCKATDQASAALVKDLRQRGLLDDTLVLWGGEFGRTNYSQGKLTQDNYGRDHHPRCFTMWMAGGGVKPGLSYGETDELGYNVARNPVHVHDFQATLLHLMGMDHEKFTHTFQGRRFRLTDVAGKVMKDILA